MAKDGILTFKGDDILLHALQTAQNMEAHKAIVKKHTSQLQKKAQHNAIFVKGYSTGATKERIGQEIMDDGFAGRVKADTEYSGYVEVGTRKMEAQPFLKPAFEEVQAEFIKDLRRAGIAK